MLSLRKRGLNGIKKKHCWEMQSPPFSLLLLWKKLNLYLYSHLNFSLFNIYFHIYFIKAHSKKRNKTRAVCRQKE